MIQLHTSLFMQGDNMAYYLYYQYFILVLYTL